MKTAAAQQNIESVRAQIRAELCDAHGLEPEQITFAENEIVPIFDYEAVSYLALKLTDIRSIECVTLWLDPERAYVTAKCDVELADGRSRSVSASAIVGEQLASGGKATTLFQAEAVAHARATRRGIRSVGVNLWRAHQQFMETGQTAAAHTRHDENLPLFQELHIMAKKLGLIRGNDKSIYEHFIAAAFGGRTSARDLSADELRTLVEQLRALGSAQRGH